MTYKCIILQVIDSIYIVTINRLEDTNKLNISCMQELINALETAETDKNCSAVIVTGNGEYFCNGGELGDYRFQSSIQLREFGKSFIELHTKIIRLSKPVIGAIQGHTRGGGFSLVEAFDLAVASEKATFGTPEIYIGLAPMMALTGIIQVLSRKGVMELSLLGDPIPAQRALEIGLINWVCKPEEVINKAMDIARQLSAKSPVAISLCKKLYYEISSPNYERQLESGLSMLVSLLTSEDAREALVAQENKRTPVWKNQ